MTAAIQFAITMEDVNPSAFYHQPMNEDEIAEAFKRATVDYQLCHKCEPCWLVFAKEIEKHVVAQFRNNQSRQLANGRIILDAEDNAIAARGPVLAPPLIVRDMNESQCDSGYESDYDSSSDYFSNEELIHYPTEPPDEI